MPDRRLSVLNRLLPALLLVVLPTILLVCLGAAYDPAWFSPAPEPPASSQSQPPPVEEPAIITPPADPPKDLIGDIDDELTGKLFVTAERQSYPNESMRLVIPRMDLDVPVQGQTTDAALAFSPGLYDYAQLPGTGNCNVSIAAHRDIKGQEFYYIDKIGEGDLFYLVYSGKIYTYLYQKTTIVQSNDWGPIRAQGYPLLTLTSCDPIGTSWNRIIVTAALYDYLDETEDFVYLPYLEGYDKPKAYDSAAISWNADKTLAPVGP